MFPFTLTQVCCLTFMWAAPVSEQMGRRGPGSMERVKGEQGNMQVVETEDVGVGEIRVRVKRSPLPFRRLVIDILYTRKQK